MAALIGTTWRFNDIVYSMGGGYSIHFVSSGTSYESISSYESYDAHGGHTTFKYGNTVVGYDGQILKKYRTITINGGASVTNPRFIRWLEGNATHIPIYKVYDEYNISKIADKIREKTGGETTYTTSEIPNGIDEVFTAGYNSKPHCTGASYRIDGNKHTAFCSCGISREKTIPYTVHYVTPSAPPFGMINWIDDASINLGTHIDKDGISYIRVVNRMRGNNSYAVRFWKNLSDGTGEEVPENTKNAVYAVIQLRTNITPNDVLFVHRLNHSDPIGARLNYTKFVKDEWITFVVELPVILKAKGYVLDANGNYPVLTESHINWITSDGAFANKGAYFDVAYAGFCKTWEEVAAIVDTDTVEYVTDRLQNKSETCNKNELPINDLTNTTWYFNDTLNLIEAGYYKVSFTFLRVNGSYGSLENIKLEANKLWYGKSTVESAFCPYNSEKGWNLESNRTITITGGADATNAEFIEWLKANATQI